MRMAEAGAAAASGVNGNEVMVFRQRETTYLGHQQQLKKKYNNGFKLNCVRKKTKNSAYDPPLLRIDDYTCVMKTKLVKNLKYDVNEVHAFSLTMKNISNRALIYVVEADQSKYSIQEKSSIIQPQEETMTMIYTLMDFWSYNDLQSDSFQIIVAPFDVVGNICLFEDRTFGDHYLALTEFWDTFPKTPEAIYEKHIIKHSAPFRIEYIDDPGWHSKLESKVQKMKSPWQSRLDFFKFRAKDEEDEIDLTLFAAQVQRKIPKFNFEESPEFLDNQFRSKVANFSRLALIRQECQRHRKGTVKVYTTAAIGAAYIFVVFVKIIQLGIKLYKKFV